MSAAYSAVVLANRFGEHRESLHRGFAHMNDDDPAAIVIFGNDGWPDERVRKEVCAIARHVVTTGGEMVGFGTSTDSSSWAMLAYVPDHEGLGNAIVEAAEASGFSDARLQGKIAGIVC